jgi:hypothetical protein
VMGHFTLPLQLKVLGWAGAGGMCAASVAFLVGAFWS